MSLDVLLLLLLNVAVDVGPTLDRPRYYALTRWTPPLPLASAH